jgi:hypothetical protein
MKLAAFAAVIAALLPIASANFDIYYTHQHRASSSDQSGYQIFDNDPSCDDVKSAPLFSLGHSDLTKETG